MNKSMNKSMSRMLAALTQLTFYDLTTMASANVAMFLVLPTKLIPRSGYNK